MTPPKSFFLTAALHDYLASHTSPPGPTHVALTVETAGLGEVAIMQVPPEQGALITLLTRLTGVRCAVEVGTFTGYSALCIAEGLAPGGRLIACDVSEEWTDIARRHWDAAGVGDRIELRLGPAIDTIRSLPDGPVLDLAFIDADKPGYVDYYEALLPRIRAGGVILADNVLWIGRVVDPDRHDADTVAVRRFNDHVMNDPRVDVVMLAISDGLSIIRKRC